jgi:phi LC3 family holin
MSKINWLVRIKNKSWWLAMIPAVLLLIQAVMSVFGYEIDFGDLGNQLKAVVEAVFVILTLVGVVNDPTTSGLSDSQQALTYETPKEDN